MWRKVLFFFMGAAVLVVLPIVVKGENGGGILGRLHELEEAVGGGSSSQKSDSSNSKPDGQAGQQPTSHLSDQEPAPQKSLTPPAELTHPVERLDWLRERFGEAEEEKRQAEADLKSKESETEGVLKEQAGADEKLTHAQQVLQEEQAKADQAARAKDADLVKEDLQQLKKWHDEEYGKIKNSKLSKKEKEQKFAALGEEYLRRSNELTGPEAVKKRKPILEQKVKEVEAARGQAVKGVGTAQEKVKQAGEKRKALDAEIEARKKKAADADQEIKRHDEAFRKQLAEVDEYWEQEHAREEREVRTAEERDEAKKVRAEMKQKTWENYQKLGLDQYRPATLDSGPETETASEKVVKETLQNLAEEVGGGPVPTDSVDVLYESYRAISQLYNPQSAGGALRIINKLQDMGYTHEEAWTEYQQILDLHREIQHKASGQYAPVED